MNRFRERILDLLRAGTSPEEISLTISLGMTLGTIPILGSTTLLCATSAFMMRLNVPLIMLVNYFVYPLQLLLYIPLLLAGARLLDRNVKILTLEGVYQMLRTDFLGTIQKLFWANLGAVLIWSVVALPVGVLSYLGMTRVMRKVSPKWTGNNKQ
jgi:uncharacterized protein (DUF2062 family)